MSLRREAGDLEGRRQTTSSSESGPQTFLQCEITLIESLAACRVREQV
jgi:hypothetical protein